MVGIALPMHCAAQTSRCYRYVYNNMLYMHVYSRTKLESIGVVEPHGMYGDVVQQLHKLYLYKAKG